MDGQEQTAAVPTPPVDGQETEAFAPVDIAEAFQYLRKANQTAAEPAGQTEEPAAPAEPEPSQPAEGAGVGVAEEPPAIEPPVSDSVGPDELAGRPPVAQQSPDYQAIGQNIINDIRNQARREVLEEFQKNNIKRVTINDIYNRAEDGTVTFNNPDDPRRPFESRDRAQAWVNSINEQIESEYQSRIVKRAGELWQEAQPRIQLLQFAPYYDQMDSMSQNIMDQLLEGREVKDREGRTIGYDCNLAQVAAQAIRIAQSFAPKQQTAQHAKQQQQPATTPAMDIKSGTGDSTDSGEPRNINEAMAMLNKQRKEKKNG